MKKIIFIILLFFLIQEGFAVPFDTKDFPVTPFDGQIWRQTNGLVYKYNATGNYWSIQLDEVSPQDDPCDETSIANLIAEVGGSAATMVINQSCDIDSNVTIPSNIETVFKEGGSFDIDGAATVTFEGHIEAGNYQIFTGAGSVVYNGDTYIKFDKWTNSANSGVIIDEDLDVIDNISADSATITNNISADSATITNNISADTATITDRVTADYITLNQAPVANSDAVRKDYADGLVVGEFWDNVAVASTATVDISTELENGDSIDSFVLTTGDRVLLKDQSDATQNGLYTVVASGAASRSTDADSASEIENRKAIPINGATNANKFFYCTTSSITLGVTNINFTELSSAAALYWSRDALNGYLYPTTLTDDVGIGLNDPEAPLHVFFDSASGDVFRIEKRSSDTNIKRTVGSYKHTTTSNMVDGFGLNMTFTIQDNAAVQNAIADFGAERSNNDDDTGDLLFSPRTNGTANERMRVRYDGRTEVLSTAGPQLRAEYTKGAIYTDFTTNSSGNMIIEPTGDNLYVSADSVFDENGSTTKLGPEHHTFKADDGAVIAIQNSSSIASSNLFMYDHLGVLQATYGWINSGAPINPSSFAMGTLNATPIKMFTNGNAVTQLEIEADGTLSVDTANYETLVTDDNDIPNKKYVDDTIAGGVPLTSTQIGYGDGSNLLTGSSNFTYNDATDILNVGDALYTDSANKRTGINLLNLTNSFQVGVPGGAPVNVVPTMTTNTTPSGIVTASSVDVAGREYRAFDQILNNSQWQTVSGTTTGWLEYQFASTKVITKYRIYKDGFTLLTQAPKDWTFEGWNGVSWDILDTQTNQSFGIGSWNEYPFANSTPYLRYRINVTANNGNAVSLVIVEMEMFESSSFEEKLTVTEADGYLGSNTTTPRAQIDSLSTTGAQLRLTHTDNSVYTDFTTDSNGYCTINPTGGATYVQNGTELRPGLGFGAVSAGNGFWVSSNTIKYSTFGAGRGTMSSAGFVGSDATGNNAGVLRITTASATNPAFAFQLDTDTGIGSNGANELSLIAGGIEGIRVNDAEAHSVAGIANYETLVIADDDIPNKKYVDDAISSGGNWSRDAGNGYLYPATLTDDVGIGLNNPDTKFHAFQNDGDVVGKFERSSADTTEDRSVLTIKHTTSGNMGNNFGSNITFVNRDSAASDNAIGDVGFQRSGADGTGVFVVQPRTNQVKNVRFKVNNEGLSQSLNQTSAQFRATYTEDAIYTDFTTNSSGNMIIEPTGEKVGINKTTPAVALEVTSDADQIRVSTETGTHFAEMSIDTGDDFELQVNNTVRYRYSTAIGGTHISSVTGAFIDQNDPSATNPVYTFNTGNDRDTGIGRAAEDQLSLIAGGVEGVRIAESAGDFQVDVNGGVRPKKVTADPCATYTEGTMFYNDTSDYYCFCNGAGDDVQMHSPATACF